MLNRLSALNTARSAYLNNSCEDLEAYARQTVEKAVSAGAHSAMAWVSENGGVRVTARGGRAENMISDGAIRVSLQAYRDGRKSAVSIGALGRRDRPRRRTRCFPA